MNTVVVIVGWLMSGVTIVLLRLVVRGWGSLCIMVTGVFSAVSIHTLSLSGLLRFRWWWFL